MELAERLSQLSHKVQSNKEILQTEEAAKTAIILPFIRALGFDVFDPDEVIPEFVADTPGKRGEKVDYALKLDGKVSILMECKICSNELNVRHAAQLFRYFTMTNARVAILTNGINYQFFSDIDEPNKMDQRPFFSFTLTDINENDVRQLERFSKANFDIDRIVENAGTLKYKSLIQQQLRSEFEDPSEEFVKLLTGRVYDGRITTNVKEEFKNIVHSAVNGVLRDIVNQRLTNALKSNSSSEDADQDEIEAKEIITTQDEIDGYRIVQAIASKITDPDRIIIRDAKSYCAVLLDDNNRRTIIRLHFNSPTNKQIGLFSGKNEERQKITRVTDIYKYASAIEARILELDGDS